MGPLQVKPGCKEPVHIFQKMEKQGEISKKMQRFWLPGTGLGLGSTQQSLKDAPRGLGSRWAAGDAVITRWQARGLDRPPAP